MLPVIEFTVRLIRSSVLKDKQRGEITVRLVKVICAQFSSLKGFYRSP